MVIESGHSGSTSDERGVVAKVWPFYPLMIVPGIVLLLAPSIVDELMDAFKISSGPGSLLQVSYFLGGVAGMLLITRMMQSFSVRKIMVVNILILVVSLCFCSLSPNYWVLLAIYLTCGFSNGILITFPGVYVTRMRVQTSHRDQNILYSFFSLGVVTGPLISGSIMKALSWRWAFAFPALLILPLALPVISMNFPAVPGVLPASRETIRKAIKFERPLFAGLIVAVLLYIAAESTVSMWVVNFMDEAHRLSSAQWVLTLIWAGITVGRWICAPLTRRIQPYRLLLFLSSGAGFSLVLAPYVGWRYLAVFLYALTGLFCSGIYPLLIGYVARFPASVSPFVFTCMLAAGAASSAALIFASGLVNQFKGLLKFGMSLISLPIFLLLLVLFWMREHIAENRA